MGSGAVPTDVRVRTGVVVAVLAVVGVSLAVALLWPGPAAVEPSRGVVTEPYRAADWTLGGRSCPSGNSSGGTADTDGTGGEATAELALRRLEERVVGELPAGVEVARRQIKPGAERVELLLLTDGGAVGGAMTERSPGAGWQLTAWWSCSP